MSSTSYFQTILSELEERGEKSVLEALRKLNANSDIRKVVFEGKLVNLVYIGKDNSYLLVKFDFINDSAASEDWLADEEEFNGDHPLYFSNCDHRVSPVFEVTRAKTFFSKLYPDSEIHMLLVCNYNIINYEDMIDIWKPMDIQIVHNIDDTDYPEFCYSEDGKRETRGNKKKNPSINQDDFDKLLDDFINSQQETDNTEEEEEDEDEEETSNAEVEKEDERPGTFKIESTKLFRGTINTIDTRRQPALKAFDIRQLEAITMSLDGTYSRENVKCTQMVVNLYNETGLLLKTDLVNVNFVSCFDYSKVDFIYTFDHDIEWKKGSYVVEIKYLNNLVMVFNFSVGQRDIKGIYSPMDNWEGEDTERPLDTLDNMVGLEQVKEQMENYRNIARLASLRRMNGLPTNLPPLHAVFMGRPGTGKSTIAGIYGKMLRELGLLSRGHVVIRTRDQLIDNNFTYNDINTTSAIDAASGGVLFIDEAHTLYKSAESRDTGRNVIETLLTALTTKSDWALVLAGYPDGIADLLSMNQGLSSRIPESNRYLLRDHTVNELMQVAESFCLKNNYLLTPDAREALRIKLSHDYHLRDENFGNARHIMTLFPSQILQAMALRVARIKSPTLFDMLTITKEDIPAIHLKDYKTSMKKLHSMVGLTELKKSIEGHLNMVKLTMLRNEQGIETLMPPLHMVFTGNPGTGKTTVASFIGEIYASLGLLSKGDLIYVERKDFVGQYIGDTEKNTTEILNRAKGNVLFIDEAYSLVPKDVGKDYGHQALEVLLSTLSKENIDMLVIMAGYPNEMEEMLKSNPGLKSRMPYTFHFNDYSADELMQIAELVVQKSKFSFTPAAKRKLRKLVEHKLENNDESWGNARFITRLISAHILPAMGSRLATEQLESAKIKDKKLLTLIRQEDIPSTDEDTLKRGHVKFDEAAVSRALKKLDSLVGLQDVKNNIHKFVKVARYMHEHGGSYTDNEPLRWNFTGNTGTGKSTVAKIIAELLKAMNLLEKGRLVELKAEEMCGLSDFKTDELLSKAMKRSTQSLLFIDGDAPQFKLPGAVFNSEILRFKLTSMTMELPGAFAFIIAENENSSNVLTRNLREKGVSSFDHTLHFPDYTEEELLAILESCLKRKNLKLSAEAMCHMEKYIHSLAGNRQLGYANARTMSKLAHSIAEAYIVRQSEKPTKNKLVLLSDVEQFIWNEISNNKIGFVKN